MSEPGDSRDEPGVPNDPEPSTSATGTGAPDDLDATPGPDDPQLTSRPLPLTVLLAVVFAINVLGLMRGFATRDTMLHEIPKFTPALFGLWTAGQAANCVGAIGLWFLRRWGLYLLALAWALSAFVDVRLAATGQAIVVTGVFWLVVLFVRPVRAALK